jgi:carboxypeptidase Taq
MGTHESQSRFYENNLGRSMEFWKPLYVKVQEFFPEELKGVTIDEFYKAINYAAPSLIRTESDELTYSFHVMIRYEIEKMIFDGAVDVNELPRIWNEKYQEYLGVTPTTDTEGILQDMHWAGGSFGYFPSYALGSAIAAQLFHYMETVMPIKQYLEEGNLAPIREFLKENIHKYGGAKNTQELLQDTVGEQFNPKYYIEYLTEKYTKLYEL